jgi:hypothetical protein
MQGWLVAIERKGNIKLPNTLPVISSGGARPETLIGIFFPTN